MDKGLFSNRVYTVKQLADALELSDITIKRKAQSGDLPHLKIFGKLYFYGGDVIDYMRKNGQEKSNPSDWEV